MGKKTDVGEVSHLGGRRRRSGAEDAFNAEVGARIEAMRVKAGVTQVRLAAEMGVPRSQVYSYETGSCSCPAYRLWQIAAILKGSADDLLCNKK